jgi:hypothetical protein
MGKHSLLSARLASPAIAVEEIPGPHRMRPKYTTITYRHSRSFRQDVLAREGWAVYVGLEMLFVCGSMGR